MTSEQKQRRFKLSQDLNFVKFFLRNNLQFDILMRIKEMVVRSFQHDFRLSKVCLVEKFNSLLFQKFQNSDTFYPCFCLGPGTKKFSSKTLSSQQEAVLSKNLDSVF